MQDEVPRIRGFTVIELAAVVVVMVILVVIFLPAMGGRHRGHSRSIQNNTQLRGIQQSMVVYAQSNKLGGGVGLYPGLNKDGTDGDLSVEHRFKELLGGNYFTPEYMINPEDRSAQVWQSGPLTSANYSYAMLQVPVQGGRRVEWSETLNTQAVVLSDRNTGSAAQPGSVWDPSSWRGTISRNDNSTSFESSHEIPDTRYGSAPQNALDHLFEAVGEDDAYLVHSGN